MKVIPQVKCNHCGQIHELLAVHEAVPVKILKGEEYQFFYVCPVTDKVLYLKMVDKEK